MLSKTIVIMDSDQTYAAALMNYLNRREEIRAEVRAFSDFESLRAYFREHSAGVLMISEGDLKDLSEVSGWRVDLIVLLTSGGTESEDEKRILGAVREESVDYGPSDRQHQDRRVVRIGKYQPVTRLMTLVDEAGREIGIRAREKAGMAEVVGVFSPVCRCSKTPLSIALSRHLASTGKRTVFISFEPFFTLACLNEPEIMQSEEGEGVGVTLEEALYLVKSREDGVEKAVQKRTDGGNLLYMIPSKNREEQKQFGQIKAEDWTHLLESFRKCTLLDAVVIDFDELPIFCPEILSICDQIYLPCLPDFISEERTTEFLQFAADLEPISDLPIRKLMMREVGRISEGTWHETEDMRREEIQRYRENLESGEIGQLAERLIREDRL